MIYNVVERRFNEVTTIDRGGNAIPGSLKHLLLLSRASPAWIANQVPTVPDKTSFHAKPALHALHLHFALMHTHILFFFSDRMEVKRKTKHFLPAQTSKYVENKLDGLQLALFQLILYATVQVVALNMFPDRLVPVVAGWWQGR